MRVEVGAVVVSHPCRKRRGKDGAPAVVEVDGKCSGRSGFPAEMTAGKAKPRAKAWAKAKDSAARGRRGQSPMTTSMAEWGKNHAIFGGFIFVLESWG